MECEDPYLFQEWMSQWQDLVEFEIVPVVSSKEAANLMAQMP
jgi:siroheme synthase